MIMDIESIKQLANDINNVVDAYTKPLHEKIKNLIKELNGINNQNKELVTEIDRLTTENKEREANFVNLININNENIDRIDKLQTKIERLTTENNAFAKSTSMEGKYIAEIEHLTVDIKSQQAEIEKLKAYAQHLPDCGIQNWDGKNPKATCTCGLEQVLRGGE